MNEETVSNKTGRMGESIPDSGDRKSRGIGLGIQVKII